MEAIKTVDLVKKFKNKTAVNKLNISVNEGEIFSLLGVNGAGKSTTIKMLTCLIKPTSGEAYLNGKSIVTESNAVKSITNSSPQDTAIAGNLTVRENLEMMAAIYGYAENAKEKATNAIKEFRFEEYEKQLAKTLSGGWQRRLSIALALITEPKILFLDEPTLGLDVIARRELWEIIEELKGKVTIVLTTHYLEEAEALSDRIAIMANGELKAVGTAEELISLSGEKNFDEAFVKIATGKELN